MKKISKTPATRDELLPAIARNVRRLRTVRKLSQDDLAQKVGVSRITINRIEQARNLPDAGLLFALADVFRTETDELRRK